MIQRTINITFGRSFAQTDNTIGGVRGEHCATRLVIQFDDSDTMLNPDYKYRLILNHFIADIKYTSGESLVFDLPSAVTDCSALLIQLIISDSDNSVVFKSNVIKLTFTEALDTSDISAIKNKYSGLMEESIEKYSAAIDKALSDLQAAIDFFNHNALTMTGTGYNFTKGWFQFRTKDGTNATQDIRTDIVDYALNEEKKITGIDKFVYLSDLNWESAVSGWNTVKKNTNVNGGRLAFKDCNGKIFYCEKGLGTHSNTSSGTQSVIKYRFAQGEYDVFEALTGVDANTTVNTPEISFVVGYLDSNGQEANEYLYDRGSNNGEFLNKNSPARIVRVDIPANATGIVLKCWAKSDTINGGGHWANWGSARFIKYAKATNPTIQEQIKNLMTGKADAAKLAAQIADNSITGAKIASGAISSAKLASSAVTKSKIADNAISLSKLEDNSVSYTKTSFLKEITNLADLTFTASGNSYISEPLPLPASVSNGDSFIYSNVQTVYFGDENGQELGHFTVSSIATNGTLTLNSIAADVLSTWKTVWIQVTAANYNAKNFRLLLPEKLYAVTTEDDKFKKFISSIDSEKLSVELYNQLAEKVINLIATESSIASPLDLNAEAAENHSIRDGELVSDNNTDVSAEVW